MRVKTNTKHQIGSRFSTVRSKMFYGIFFTISGFIMTGFVLSLGFFLYQNKVARIFYTVPASEHVSEEVSITFPLGVDPKQEVIVENPELDLYLDTHSIVKKENESKHVSWIQKTFSKLALLPWYQNLASASTRTLVIQSGERREQVADNFGKILGWSNAEKAEFIDLIQGVEPAIEDGKYFPGIYVTNRAAKPLEVAPLVIERFTGEVLARYSREVEDVVPLSDALTIASLLEREAYDFIDMREISGVIWNRLFVDMRLQIDATLQYAKGSDPHQVWWPKVRPGDKYIASAYNTYKNGGLPPAPIANPSLEAIVAALNPKATDCMYYFHDRKSGFHCAKTYEEHVALLKEYYGRGK